MCGLAGLISNNKSKINIIIENKKSVIESITHRGPDHQDTWSDDNCILFHTRLSIIDLDIRSSQPFHSATDKSVLVFNGEIYNYKELQAVYDFNLKTASDTEVLIELLEKKGSLCLDQIDGMFSFAFYNKYKKCVTLAVDPAGKKPLYTYWDGNTFAFASEIKTFKTMGINLEKNEDSIAEYLFYGYIPSPQTFYKNIHKLEAGSFLEADLSGPKSVKKYYHLPRKKMNISYSDAKAEAQRLIALAVKKRIVSDRPVGFFLSGGVDSSVVCLEASKLIDSSNLRTYSASFKNSLLSKKYDESIFADLVAKKIKSQHKVFEIQTLIDDPEKIIKHFDEPYADSSCFPTAELCKQVSSEVKVALSGDGADEIFGGYDRFKACLIAENISFSNYYLKKFSNISLLNNLSKGRLKRFTSALDENNISRVALWNSFFNFSDLKKYSNHFHDKVRSHLSLQTEYYKDLDPLEQILHFNFDNYLQNDLLPKVDRMSMLHGLEVRSPFLDKELINFCFQLPSEYKVNFFQTKKILKDIYRPQLGSEIIDRTKKGFGFPLETLMNQHDYTKHLPDKFKNLSGLADTASKKYCAFVLSQFYKDDSRNGSVGYSNDNSKDIII